MKQIRYLILFAVTALSLSAQSNPSKEYIRLGSRVIAVEAPATLAPPTLTPSGDPNAANYGETGTNIEITGPANSSWSASSSGSSITITSAASGMTDATGKATLTYDLGPNTQQTPFTGSIQVTMESGTAVYNIIQQCCATEVVTLSPTSATAPANPSSSSVTVQSSSNSVAWTVSNVQSCFSSVSPMSGAGSGTIAYSLNANTSTQSQTCSFTVTPTGGSAQTFRVTQAGAAGLSESNPSLTLTGPGTYSVTVTADGIYTVNVLNWTGWQPRVSASNPAGWLTIQNITTGSVQYKTSGGSGSGTITFTDGVTTLSLNVTESTVGGSCSASPTLSLSSTSIQIPPGGGTYSVQVNSNTNWTASCSNANGEGLTFTVSGNPNTGICTVPLTGSGNQTLNVNLTYNHANPPGFLSTTLNVTTCGGSAAQSADVTVSQGAQTFTVTPSSHTIYQNYENSAIQFEAYLNGSTTYPPTYSVSWSLSDPSGYSGTINSSGLYTPPNPVPTNFGSVTVTAHLSDGSTATAVINVLSNPYAPEASVTPNSGTGSGTTFQFEFDTPGDPPPSVSLIQTATIAFSTTATSQNQIPTVTTCAPIIFVPGYGTMNSTIQLGSQSAGVSTTVPGQTWSQPALWSADCSINLRGTESTLYTWNTSNGQPTAPVFANIPLQFYQNDDGLTGIWATTVQNGSIYTTNLFLGNYTVTSPAQTVSPASITLNTNGQTQQFTGMAAGNTPIPDVVWNAPSPPVGSINSAGLYRAPNPLTALQTISISGTRLSDGSSICCATVVLSPVSISVNPQTVSLSAGQTQTITAIVNGTSNQSVTWSTPSPGTFSNGVYTAPSSIPSQQIVTLTATSTVDPSKSASVTITLVPVAVSVAPTSVSLEINQTQTFAATVTGTTNQAVTWTVSPPGAGSINSSGLYTAPGSIPTGQTVTVTATSTVDTSKSSSAQITLIPDTLTIAPAAGASLTEGQSQQLTATVAGATNTAVSWSMTPSVGTLSSGGYYTAPSAIATQQTVVITATSQADGALAKSVNVVLNPPASGPAASIAATAGTPQGAAVGMGFSTQLQATVKDSLGNAVSGATVTFTAPASGASGAFSGSLTASAITDSNGVATAPTITAGTTLGTYSVTASVAGLSSVANFELTNNAVSGGTLAGAVNASSSAVNLTTEGGIDWVHWGDSSLNRKAGVAAELSNYSSVGSGSASSYANDPRPISWADGTPTGTATNNVNGLALTGLGQGFSFTAPAGTTTQTLVVHVGGYDSGGTFTAYLSDGSAVAYSDTTSTVSGQYDRNYTLSYAASSAGQYLTVIWSMTSGTGGVTLSAAALVDGPPTVVSFDPSGTGASAVFTAVAQDDGGASAIQMFEVVFWGETTDCHVVWLASDNNLYLDDASPSNFGNWVGSGPISVAGTLSNGVCTLDLGASSVTLSGNSLTLNLALSFQASDTYYGETYAANATGGSNGGNWTPFNTWTVPTLPTETVSIPSSPNGATTGTTEVNYSYSTGGAVDSLGNAIQYQFNWGDGTNSDWLATGTTSASHTWTAPGLYTVTAQARSAVNTSVVSSTSALQVSISDGPPTMVSFGPSGTGASAVFTAVAQDDGGASAIQMFEVVFWGETTDCHVVWLASDNNLYLDDASPSNFGNWVGSGPISVAGTLSNGVCTLDLGASSVTLSGNSLTLNLALSFQASDTYYGETYAENATGGSNGGNWTPFNTWTVP